MSDLDDVDDVDDVDGLNSLDDLDAGGFSSWMTHIEGALRGEHDSAVPCASCTACCTSSQFIHVGPDETDTLAHIPKPLLFPAPRLPRGHLLLGYDERGHCPMLIDNQCSIYEHRPKTCRTYDCRVFAATGVGVDDGTTSSIARQARRWRFSFPEQADRNQQAACSAAARFLVERADLFPGGAVPTSPTQLAVLAIEIHDAFLRHNAETGDTTLVDPDPDVVRVEVLRRTRPRPTG